MNSCQNWDCHVIKRFIDGKAKFVWIDRPRDRPRGAVGFDFDGAEFTHEDNRITFEGLETILTGIKSRARGDDEMALEAGNVFDLFYSAYAQNSAA